MEPLLISRPWPDRSSYYAASTSAPATGSGWRSFASCSRSSNASPEQLARRCEQQIASRFGLDIRVVVRTRDELAEVVQCNPLGKVAVNPKRYQVTFMAAEPNPEAVRKLAAAAVASEQFVVIGRELYAWHPEGIGRSRLSALPRRSTARGP
jgi:uncharacterized protein (DUF1697 family)